MSRDTICIAYAGRAVDTGAMAINELAPALLAFSDLVDEANKVLNNDGSKVNVYVKSNFQKGSFEINLEIARTLSDQIKMMFNVSHNYTVTEILGYIGLASTLSGVSVLELIRWLKGRKIKKATKLDKDTIRIFIESEQEEHIDVSTNGVKLFRSMKIRKAFEGMLSPLETDGIDAFEVRDKETDRTSIKVSKDEASFYKKPDIESETLTNEFTNRILLRVSSVNFEQNLKWRFDNGDTKFYATVEDEQFVAEVENGEVSFFKGVSLDVDLKTVQTMYDDNIKTEYSVVKVHKIIGKSEQLPLDLE